MLSHFFNNLIFFNIIFVIDIICILYILFSGQKNYAASWAWMMLIVCIPIIGFFIYLIFGHSPTKRKTFSKKEEEDRYMYLLHTQKDLLTCTDNLEEHCNTICTQEVLKLHLLGHELILSKHNSLTIYTDGNDKFQALFDAIENAKESIHLEYYIIHNDTIGKHFQSLLIKKAKEGVRILLLYDAIGCHLTPKSYFKSLKDAGIEMACFYPSRIPFISLRVNYRNHRKICVIDGHTAFLGGFNVGDEYVGKNKKMGYWRDTHLKIEGEAAKFCDLQFLLDWRFATNQILSLNQPLSKVPFILNEQKGVPMHIVASGPDSRHHSILNGYLKLITEAKESICIQTPYLIPNESILHALKIAALSGIDVRIMIPNKPDHLFVYWATYSYIGELLPYGVKAYTYENGFLHAKTIVIDQLVASVGTANFDIRSFKLNFEINAFIYDKETAITLYNIFEKDLLVCKAITPEHYEKRSLLIKLKEPISKLFSPLL